MGARRTGIAALAGIVMVTAVIGGLTLFVSLFMALGGGAGGSGCVSAAAGAGLLPAAGGAVVGATEYGGPGDPASGTVGSSGVDLLSRPDSYAELGGTTFATADALGGLAYGTPLRITWGQHSLVAYKEDIGLGGGPIAGHPRAIDLWFELAAKLHIPYEDGLWSGAVRIERTPATGAAGLLGATPATVGAGAVTGPPAVPAGASGAAGGAAATAGAGASAGLGGGLAWQAAAAVSCAATSSGELAVATTAGPRAELLGDGQAVAPAQAPAVVKEIIAAGNQIVAKPYVYGGGHGLPLSSIAPGYDCSSSVAHLLWGGGLLGPNGDMTSTGFESWGLPGPGRWVTLYASPEHVFMYVAGLRWDTHNAAGPGDGSSGIGWHPLVREANGFVVRHPAGL